LQQKPKQVKRQIRIDALDPAIEEEAPAKRVKMDGAKSSSIGGAGLHGLLGMLPAPKQSGVPPTAAVHAKSAQEAPANNMGIAGGSEGRLEFASAATETKKVKGNNDFRAMLGLKPSTLVVKPTQGLEKTISTIPLPAGKQSENVKQESAVTAAPTSFEERSERKDDFFSLQDAASSTSAPKATTHSFAISTAPIVEDEQENDETREKAEKELYRGWQQGPDGNWFPVTPEAHAAYHQFLSTQAIQAKEQDNRPADMQFSNIDAIQSVDANASREAWLARPSSDIDPASSGLDRKFAMAAASMAMPDQGVPLVDQEEEIKKMDKKTNVRARKKGQLSALIAQAEESREKLEQRWSRGKDGRNTAKSKYGF
jgi:hypothetical protein